MAMTLACREGVADSDPVTGGVHAIQIPSRAEHKEYKKGNNLKGLIKRRKALKGLIPTKTRNALVV